MWCFFEGRGKERREGGRVGRIHTMRVHPGWGEVLVKEKEKEETYAVCRMRKPKRGRARRKAR